MAKPNGGFWSEQQKKKIPPATTTSGRKTVERVECRYALGYRENFLSGGERKKNGILTANLTTAAAATALFRANIVIVRRTTFG